MKKIDGLQVGRIYPAVSHASTIQTPANRGERGMGFRGEGPQPLPALFDIPADVLERVSAQV